MSDSISILLCARLFFFIALGLHFSPIRPLSGESSILWFYISDHAVNLARMIRVVHINQEAVYVT
ncbi:MAG: hypothetical protein HKP12_00120 [Gammaproteobacteria bacterium]|nr:hypothetical protein [Gammaproteobacteria bacterium]